MGRNKLAGDEHSVGTVEKVFYFPVIINLFKRMITDFLSNFAKFWILLLEQLKSRCPSLEFNLKFVEIVYV